MKTPFLTVKDIVSITGITARTLHYYDKIDLFKPTYLAENGYRHYDRSSLERLQTILFLKEMDFSLKEIGEILKLTKQEQKKILKSHSKTLLSRKQRLETIMLALEDYVSGKDIYNLGVFNHSSVLPLQEQYAREASLVYAETEAYKSFQEKLNQVPASEKEKLFAEFEQGMENVFRKLAACVDQSPESLQVQKLIVEWRNYVGKFMTLDAELLGCLADTYKYDGRFKNYINQYSNQDLADFISSAIRYHVDQIAK
ncbi:MerR family transcriptional regulator [Paenibacillus senegalimassiliensis]|uniref:MerR family transcriptional regulator n=1 Tax=Paenibacillus senegalimassiliensis TaxID=1737426 RepID=UPI00073E904A|nr:MerR family transcriptional regulator [Paenibacillus senegalimassiliensis]